MVVLLRNHPKKIYVFEFMQRLAGVPPLDNSRTSYAFAFFAFLLARSLANRSAVRFFAAALDAFFARADRSSAVMVSRLRFPPFAPIAPITCRIRSRDIRLPMHLMIQPHRLDVIGPK